MDCGVRWVAILRCRLIGLDVIICSHACIHMQICTYDFPLRLNSQGGSGAASRHRPSCRALASARLRACIALSVSRGLLPLVLLVVPCQAALDLHRSQHPGRPAAPCRPCARSDQPCPTRPPQTAQRPARPGSLWRHCRMFAAAQAHQCRSAVSCAGCGCHPGL